MAEMKDLRVQIPLELHAKVCGEREQQEQTASQYITELLMEYHKMEENGGKMTMANNGSRTMAFQIPEEPLQRIRQHLERESTRSGRKVTQRELVLDLIEETLEQTEEEATEKEATQEKCGGDAWQPECAPKQPYNISQRKPLRVSERRIGYPGGPFAPLQKEGKTTEQQRNRLTDAEMEIARETDLPNLLESLGYQVKRVGRYHTTKEMDGLRIKNRRIWFRYSEGVGGDAITSLQRFCGKSFPEVVEYLLDYHGWAWDSPTPQKSVPSKGQDRQKDEPPPPFVLPLPNTDQRCVFAHLQKRSIAPQVIRGFIQAGLLYEDVEHHNCMFVGRNRSETPVLANKHGTYDRSGPGFKGDVIGGDKNTAFRLPCRPELNAVLIFEAPIDLMGYYTLHRQVISNVVALCGLHKGALDTYLRENPQLGHIVLCLDADEPDQSAVECLRTKYKAAGYMAQSRTPPYGKDWNEYLQQRSPIRERGDLRQAVTR